MWELGFRCAPSVVCSRKILCDEGLLHQLERYQVDGTGKFGARNACVRIGRGGKAETSEHVSDKVRCDVSRE